MEKNPNARIRLFGNLYTLRRKRGLPTVAEIWLPDSGRPACEVAEELDLPLERIEGVFCNHFAHGLDHLLRPGDEIAFIPTGVPGPHRYMLGIHEAGKRNRGTNTD